MTAYIAETEDPPAGNPEILFIDDDPLIVESLSYALENEFQIHTAESRKQTREVLHKLGRTPSIALVDLGLPPVPHSPEEGFKLIGELLAYNPNIKILVLSGQDDSANIKHALTLGAVDFVSKPCDVPLLRSRLKYQQTMVEAELAEEEGRPGEGNLLGESPAIRTLHEIIGQFADTPFPVLLEGESGTGKELVARYLHERSSHSGAPFLTINCAAFSPELLEAQLFGHAKGAYTGATTSRSGFFEDASDGSLVLDEIGEMPLALQSKLLRVLENGEYYRLGETRARTSRARIIAATNRDLQEETKAGRFRKDLYHRLTVLTITVPPLRDRGDDCLILLEHFKKLYAVNNRPFELDEQAARRLADYSFPGNVRELRNIVIRLSSKYPGKKVGPAELENELETGAMNIDPDLPGTDAEGMKRQLLEGDFSLEDALNEQEKNYILYAIEISGGNLSKAARYLGINRTTLYSRMQRLSIKTTY